MKKIVLFLSLLLTMFAFSSRAQVTVFSEGFEDGGLPAGWTNIDSDGDGNTWVHNSTTYVDGHTGEGAYVSFSKLNTTTALTPDNWLVTPAIPLAGNSTLKFWRMSGFGNVEEHYGIFVSTTSATDLTSFTLVYDETLPSYHWAEKTVDLSAYAGQSVYIAFRHYNCTNKLALILDDVSVTTTAASSIITAVPTALQFLNVPAGAPTASQVVAVTGYNLTGAITASVSSPFEVSLDNTTFSGSVTMASTDSVVYVRYFPAYANNDTASLTLTDGSTTTAVLLSGNSVECNITLPYTQNFNSVPQNGLPACWTKINSFDGYPKAVEGYGTDNDDKVLMFKCNYNTYEPIYAVMPPMPLNLSNLQISFYTFREGSYSGTLSVGYVTSPGDTNSFVPVWSINAAQIGDNNPHPYVVSFGDIGTDPSAQYFITFKYETSSNWYWFVDDITVDEISTCAPPSSLAVTNVTSSSATLHWSGNVNSYTLYYKTAADTDWTQIPNVPMDTSGYLLNNLQANTSYTWFVAANCDDGTTSNSLENLTFTTECGDYTTPFMQDFNASSTFPQCWSRYSGLASEVFAGTALTPVTSNYSGWRLDNSNVFGLRHASLNIYGTGTKYWLVTPPINLSGLSNPTLTFDLALTKWNSTNPIDNPSAQQDDKFMVIVSTDYGATWSASNAIVWSNDTTANHVFNQISTTGEEINISLANYANQTVMIAFYGESTVTNNGDNDLHIDNVMVNNATSCLKPNNLTVTAVTDNSVTLTWTENGTATAWNIEYGPVGFTPGSGSGTVVAATTNPFTVTNLSATPYHFYIQSNCGDEQSLWSGPASATPGSYNMGINGSDTITTCSMLVYDNGGANGNYSDNCNYTLVIYPEVTGNMIAVSGSYNTENNWDFLYIYDGVGTDGTMLGEFSGTGNISTLVSSSGPITIQFTSDVSSNMGGFALTVSCAACLPPGNLTVSNVGANSADLSWSGQSQIYMVEYQASGDTAWETTTLSDTVFALTGLTPTTTYTVNVYGDCGDNYSPAATVIFTTTMAPTTLPYTTDFSAGSDQNWLMNNGSCANHWAIGSVGDNDNALFITNNGTTPGYNTSTFSIVTTEKLFTIGAASEFIISFDVEIGGESNFDYIKAFFAPADSIYPATNTNVEYANVPYSLHAVNFADYLQYTGAANNYTFNLTNDNTIHVTVVMPNPNANPNANSTAKLVFLWRNDTSTGEQPGAVIHSVSVEPVACPMPVNLTTSSLTTTSAVIEWTPGGNEDAWTLEYKEATDSVWTSESIVNVPTYSLYNLLTGVTYEVRVQAVCGVGSESLWTNLSFTTPCDAFNTFPYTEGFEHDGDAPDCWTQEYVHGTINWTFRDGTDLSSGIASAHSGSYNACFYQNNDNGYITRLVTPIFDLSNLSNPYLTYWFAQKAWGYDQDALTIYYRTSPDADWIILAQHYNSVPEWTFDSVALPNPTATYQLAFTGLANGGYGIVLDDITIDGEFNPGPEPCDAPTNLQESGIIFDKALGLMDVIWDNPGGASQWNLQYRLENESTWTTVTVNEPHCLLQNLVGGATYVLRVQAICDNGTLSDWSNTLTASAQYVGIDNWLENSVTLFPNPANEYIHVECRMQNVEYSITDIQLFDVFGKMIWTNDHMSIPTRINVSGLADGMYFVRVTTDKGTVTKRFVKK